MPTSHDVSMNVKMNNSSLRLGTMLHVYTETVRNLSVATSAFKFGSHQTDTTGMLVPKVTSSLFHP